MHLLVIQFTIMMFYVGFMQVLIIYSLKSQYYKIIKTLKYCPIYNKMGHIVVCDFGGLGVSVLAFSTKVRGFKPGRSRRIFQGGKILSTLSFGREVKPLVPCRRFAACKRSLYLRGSRNLGKITGQILAHTVPPFAGRISRVIADVQAPGGESGNV